jgi:type IV pilus assembly protein PilC
MPEFTLKYADARGEIHQKVMEAESETEIRDKLSEQGFLVYTVKERSSFAPALGLGGKKLDLEKFLIFNQQFVTLFRAGLPILKCLDLLAERLTDKRLSPHIKEIRDDVKKGSLLSDAFARQGVFPPIYVSSVLAGEKSGALGDVLERYVQYQKLALSVRKKILVSLMYPSVLLALVVLLVVFLISFVVPRFADLYASTNAKLPAPTQILIAIGTSAQEVALFVVAGLVGGVIALRMYLRTETGKRQSDRVKLSIPVLSEVWVKYQVAQIARLLSTLMTGGIPLVQGMETASQSMDSPLLKDTLLKAQKMVREGQSLSTSLASTGIMPPLAIDMIEVGESTGALPQMLSSVAEFYEDDVATRVQASLSLIEPAIMLFMGAFVAFVLVSLYLPIFSLADSL